MMKNKKTIISLSLIGIFLFIGIAYSQFGGWGFYSPVIIDGNNVIPRGDDWSIKTSQDFEWAGELLPDGSTCSNTEILKKTGTDNWDCAADDNTNANTICSGTTTYLDGEGNCDDISGVYVPYTGATSDVNISDSHAYRIGDIGFASGGDGNYQFIIYSASEGTKESTWDIASLTTGRTYTFPDLTGNILLEESIDASSELLAIMDDETGTGALVFGTSPTITTSIDLPAGAINTATEIAADIITHTQILDADQADTKCIWFEDPTADDDFNSIWANKTANDFLLTEIWCESDQTIDFDLQVDDGTPADVNGTDIQCAASENEDTSLGGDTTLAAGEELDLVVTSVANTPTWVSICWTGNWVD